MTSALTCKGSYRYESEQLVEQAFAAVREILQEDDPDVPDPFETGEFVREGLEVRVHIDTSCPSEWLETYEGLVETLATTAASGSVSSAFEGSDQIKSFPAGPPWWAKRGEGTP